MVDSETKIAILFHEWAQPRHDLKPSTPDPRPGAGTASSGTWERTTARRPGSAWSTGRWSAWPARASPRPRSTTSPAPPAFPGPPPTGPSRGARRESWPPSSRPRWPGCSRRWPSPWARRATSRTCWWPAWSSRPAGSAGHEPLTYLLEHEPGAVLPYVTFGGFDRVMRVASDLAAPFFARWLEPEQASRAAEWAVRIVMAYCSDPSPHADLTDPADTRALVRTLRPAGHPRPAPRDAGGGTATAPDVRPHFEFDPTTTNDQASRSTRPTTKGAAQ